MADRMPPVGRMDLVSEDECEAMNLLHKDGYEPGELAFMLERKHRTVNRHLDGECDHLGVGQRPALLADGGGDGA